MIGNKTKFSTIHNFIDYLTLASIWMLKFIRCNREFLPQISTQLFPSFQSFRIFLQIFLSLNFMNVASGIGNFWESFNRWRGGCMVLLLSMSYFKCSALISVQNLIFLNFFVLIEQRSPIRLTIFLTRDCCCSSWAPLCSRYMQRSVPHQTTGFFKFLSWVRSSLVAKVV